MTKNKNDIIRDIARKLKIPLTPADINTVANQTDVRQVRHKTVIVNEGEVCPCCYYVVSGLLRYYFNEEGKELTTYIADEGNTICCFESFYDQTPSRAVIKTIEPSTLFCIDRQALTELATKGINLSRFCFAFHALMIQSAEEFYFIARIPKLAERYQAMTDKYPEIVRRTPVGVMATLLQTRGETLSRVRKRFPDDALWSAFLERQGESLKDRG